MWFSTLARPSSVSRVKFAASYEAAPGSRNSETVLHTDPRNGAYRLRKTFKRGTSVPLPESLGVSVELSVDLLLDGDED
ncbi:hypothetical protein [Streptomyces sp. IGB124]|uniref:hypothetical protein n=1 Tax=Streptomyces sp. IGB124 TaxID=1519485 RepID=UPI0018FE9987|nr:hypothetical protein [Streptomyces sp. IGB124]